MRQAPITTRPSTEPRSDLVRRLASGASVEEMMRRGEIGGQALGLIQMMAAGTPTESGPLAHARGSNQRLVESN